MDGLPAKEAVSRWLALYDQMLTLPGKTRISRWDWSSSGESVGLGRLMRALPGPEAWGEMAEQINRREIKPGVKGIGNLCLCFLMHTLMSDSDGQVADVVKLTQVAKESGVLTGYGMLGHHIERLREDLASRLSNDLVRNFEETLDSTRAYQRVRVPNLVELAGEGKARELLTRALKSDNVFDFPGDDATTALARVMVEKDPSLLKRAQWGLATDPECSALFEAMLSRFPVVKTRSPGAMSPELGMLTGDGLTDGDFGGNAAMEAWVEGANAYLTGLLETGRVDDVMAFLKKYPLKVDEWRGYRLIRPDYYDTTDDDLNPGYLLSFYEKMLVENPGGNYWDRFVNAGARAGKSQVPIERIRKVLADPKTSPGTAAMLKEKLVNALLGAGETQEALTLMREEFPPAAGVVVKRDDGYYSRALKLLKAVEQVPDAKAQEDVVRVLTGVWESAQKGEYPSRLLYALVWHEVGNKRPQNAEKLLKRALMKSTYKDPAASDEDRRRSIFGDVRGLGDADQELFLLAQVYYASERHTDVLELLDKAPWWNGTDLAAYMGRGCAPEKDSLASLPVMAATALLRAGKPQEARRIIYPLLDCAPGHDPAYALLLEVDGEEAGKKLDALFAVDPFEERPLIWKAQLLLNQKKLDAAETTARAAIAIDPSDGEQGHGRRMRVYAVLRDILLAKGQTKEAALYANVVKAIRLAEEADNLHAAGLKGKAIKMYEQSLEMFADAYCIQSRLAVQLMEAGRPQEAEAHYRKAFELMPDSFGRVESHCFGCEGVFKSGVAQGVAERVFEKLAKETPDKAQVHYLLGYLRNAQGRDKEALANFKEAVRLDKDYLNAWERISSIAKDTDRPLADEAVFNLIRLDPLGRHTYPAMESVKDLKGLWRALSAAPKKPADPKEVYPLAGAVEALKKQTKAEPEVVGVTPMKGLEWDERSPRTVIMARPLIQVLQDVVNSIGSDE